mmetsp:Transcript_12038/g.21160  ORF Transcript_12038/g.21160 Transcript_12038/m.21160 type:complete len:640 (-) Transcript_12038:61-1980(-)
MVAEEEHEEEHGEEHEEHHREEKEVQPVPFGKVQLVGAFCGTVTTHSHCFQISIPLDYEIPIATVVPVMKAFKEAAETHADEAEEMKEEEGEEKEEEHHKEAKHDLLEAKTWQDLIAEFGGDAVDLEKVLDEHEARPNVARSPYKAKIAALKATLEALKVDFEKRGIALDQAERENAKLREEVEKLSNRINHEIVNTIKADFLGHEVIQTSDVMIESESQLLSAAEAIENSVRGSTNAELRAKLQKAPTAELPVPQESGPLHGPIVLSGYFGGPDIKLGGAFMGEVTSSQHCFHISLPIEGKLPAQLVLEAIRALKASNPTVEEKKEEGEGEGEHGEEEHGEEEGEKEPKKLISMKVFEDLERIFESECMLPGPPKPAASVAPSEPSPEPYASYANMVKLADEAANDGAPLFESNGEPPAPAVKDEIISRGLEEKATPRTQYFSMEDEKAVAEVVDTSLAREKEEVAAFERAVDEAVGEVGHAGQRISKAEARVLEMSSQVKHLAEVNRESADRVALSQKQVQLLKEEVQKMLPFKKSQMPALRSLGEMQDAVSQSPRRDGYHDWLSSPPKGSASRTSPIPERYGTGLHGLGLGSTVSSSTSPSLKMSASPGTPRKPINKHVEELQKLAEEMRSWGVVN